MTQQIEFPGVIVGVGVPSKETFSALDRATHDWEMRAARGECAWICADCCMGFPDGMPTECPHGHQSCTDIINRDKELAQEQGGSDGS
ncbi:hypothetical protein [Castellaniella sp.]|uniref:hypothetical protein n=1 Tax=Castellaniella sp. TaxID=1955812 RepID=UPI002AFF1835|nr:hypothetical protein [Castellaniella sp.]